MVEVTHNKHSKQEEMHSLSDKNLKAIIQSVHTL